jgi:1,4-alpha-glucan branching enzyme
MLRLITLGLAGQGYLNFIGNEFGHPEWVDFPREGNGWSFHYARRQWSLRDDPNLKYRFLAEFDRAMISLASATRLLEQPWAYKHYEHVEDKVLVFSRTGLIFAFNFDPNRSYDGREVFINPGRYALALSTDSAEFGGFNRIDPAVQYETTTSGGVKLYLPARSAVVLRRL